MFDFISIFVCFALTSGLRSDAIHHQHQSRLSSKLYCVLPPYPAHGTYIVLDEAEPGQAVSGTALSISCDPGYEVPGLNEIIVCYKSLWSRDVPDCKLKVDKCVLPPYPAHGSYRVDGMTRTVPGQEFPTVALTIICNPGYGIEGEKQRICFNGIWSGSIPDCKETLGACILPPFPENGSYAVVGAPDAVPGQAFDNVALIISCNFGHAVPGRKDRTCYMGIWSEEIFDCAPTSELCVLPPFPDHGRYVVWTLPNYYFTPGQVYDFVLVETVCDEEYESLHHRYTGCRDGSWLYDMECVHKPPKISDPDFDHKQDVPIKYLRAYNVSISQSACILPPQPGNGSYSVIGVPNAALGQAFDNVALMISCNTGFGISGRKDRTCFNGIWLANITNCVPISDLEAITPATRNFVTLGNTDLQSQFGMSDSCYLGENPTVNYRCQLSPTSKETRECNLHEPVGTIVRPECKENFFYPGVLNPMRCFASGWNFVPSCIPECGYITPTFELLVEDTAVGGTFAKSGEVPWHAGIYDKKQDYEQICGGTIIRPTVVVSAGHCFVDRMAVAQHASRYAVAVGKLMRSWYDSDDYEAQMFNVTEVIIPKGFQGSIAHFQEDIALVFLDQPIMFTTLIQPVCLDFSPEIEKEQLQKGKKGMVAGWGLTSENKSNYARHLQVLRLPYVPIEECQAEAPLDFRPSITGDKICAGYKKAASVSTLPSTSIINEQQNNTCSSSYFEYPCRDGGCVSVSSVCNGVAECPDGSDEALCDFNSTSLELHHLAVEPSHRWKRQAGCKKNQFACKNGVDCIRFDGKCDGVKDCPDGSDETFPLCRKIPCPSHLFRCTYGACVDGTAPCNRIQDCVDNSDELLPRCRNETDEVRGIFRCDDGSTIPAYSHCDGIKDCKDGSDETISACAGKICADYVFQCAYGACVDANSDCNGKEECADGSDESDELCNRIGTGTVGPAVPPTPTSTGPCLLPPYPKNGRYVVSGRPNATPGQSFDTVGFNVTCDPGFRVVGKKERLCYYGTWNEETISCVRFCRLVKDPSVDFHCQLKDNNKGTRPCEDFEPDGTVVIPTCKTSDYYFPGVLGYMTCYDGNWDYVARCFAECGLVTPDGTGLIAGPEGKPAKKGELPWHTGIYRRTKDPPEQICGGSLVNTRTVISAAHCFWGKQKQQKQPAALFAVALGKIYRVWNHPGDEESEVQRSDILAIHIPAHFQGSRTNYQHDAAVLQLTEKITYYPHIRPVCVSFDLVFQSRQLIDGRKGKVAGWGLTGANDDASPTLKTVSLPFVSVEECLLQSPPDFRVYITGDKICAGFRNGSAVCHGDSGGGLTFPERDERGLERYYLRGVVSTAPEDGNACNVNWLTTFTLLSRLEDFLKPFLRT